MTLRLSFSYVTALLLIAAVVCLVIWFVVESANTPGGLIFARNRITVTWWDKALAKLFLFAAFGCFAGALWTIGTLL